jgi:hypothetical protein
MIVVLLFSSPFDHQGGNSVIPPLSIRIFIITATGPVSLSVSVSDCVSVSVSYRQCVMKVSSYADACSSEEGKGESGEEPDDWSDQESEASTSLSEEGINHSGRFSDESDTEQLMSQQPMKKTSISRRKSGTARPKVKEYWSNYYYDRFESS